MPSFFPPFVPAATVTFFVVPYSNPFLEEGFGWLDQWRDSGSSGGTGELLEQVDLEAGV